VSGVSPRRQQIAAASCGASAGVLFVWFLDLAGVALTPAAGAVLASMFTTVVISLGRDGVRGLARKFWRGVNGNGGGT
jgi:hypothetical protein